MDRVSGQLGSTSPITATVKRDYEIAAAGFEKLLEEMRVLVDVDLKKAGRAARSRRRAVDAGPRRAAVEEVGSASTPRGAAGCR